MPQKKKAAKKAKTRASKKKVAKKVKKVKKAVKKSSTKKVKKASSASRIAKLMPLASTYRPAPNEKDLGEVEDYFSKIGVIALTLKNSVSLGQIIHVHGHTTDLTEKVESMQIEHVSVTQAKAGDSVGIKVGDKCRKGDKV